MKKNFVFMALAALAALTGCGDKDNGNNATLTITGDGIGAVKEIKLSEVATASVKVNIEASEKIENLKVAITSNSPAFTAAVVGFAGLDVANPGLLGGALTELGLKNGDAVKGQTELEFDITPFVPMIFGVMMDASETEATADFALTVVDTKGNSKTETVKLKLTVDVNPAAE